MAAVGRWVVRAMRTSGRVMWRSFAQYGAIMTGTVIPPQPPPAEEPVQVPDHVPDWL
ncbi:hypothetical protein [Actinoplanes sp. G11-F43]|uniref:hypothetical protein n=1 Tax=Actinoplanes sp. G11-F43 TaxID=3424130 RepID=UPI003D331E8C